MTRDPKLPRLRAVDAGANPPFQPETIAPQDISILPAATVAPHAARDKKNLVAGPNATNRNPFTLATPAFHSKPLIVPAPDVTRRIYILGVGSVGKLFAHLLSSEVGESNITLLFRRVEQLMDFDRAGRQITLSRNGLVEARSGFRREAIKMAQRFHGYIMTADDVKKIKFLKDSGMDNDYLKAEAKHLASTYNANYELRNTAGPPIKNLILTVKAPGVVPALQAVKQRLSHESTVLFVLNGIGFVEDAVAEVFPEPQTRPKFMLAINSHGVNTKPEKPFETVHAGLGNISIGNAPVFYPRHGAYGANFRHGAFANPNCSPAALAMTESSEYLLRSVTRTTVLAAVGFCPIELLKLQLEKLAINAVINPLTAMFDCRNGDLLFNYNVTRVMRMILGEVSRVILHMKELENEPDLFERFKVERLEASVIHTARRTGDNISSMLADVRAGKRTEIEYINGWIVRKGDELGVACGYNSMIMQMVMARQQMVNNEKSEEWNLNFPVQ